MIRQVTCLTYYKSRCSIDKGGSVDKCVESSRRASCHPGQHRPGGPENHAQDVGANDGLNGVRMCSVEPRQDQKSQHGQARQRHGRCPMPWAPHSKPQVTPQQGEQQGSMMHQQPQCGVIGRQAIQGRHGAWVEQHPSRCRLNQGHGQDTRRGKMSQPSWVHASMLSHRGGVIHYLRGEIEPQWAFTDHCLQQCIGKTTMTCCGQ